MKKKNIGYTWLTLLIFWVVGINHTLLAQEQKIENALFWEVSGKGLKKPSYLFGTYHLLNHSFLEDIPNVKTAFEKSGHVTVEMVIDSSKLQHMAMASMMPDKKISELISADDYKLVADEIKSATGMDLKILDQFKPVALTVLLTLFYTQRENKEMLSKYSGTPLDAYFAYAGKINNKSVNTFETMEEQLKILYDHDSYEEQARQLVEFVKAKEEMIKAQTDLANLYLEQDLNGMYALFQKYSEQMGESKHLLDDRNVKWMEKLPALLQSGNQFIAVGALHFTGEKSLITLLRKAGYTVKPKTLK